jgi:hypothetical protein
VFQEQDRDAATTQWRITPKGEGNDAFYRLPVQLKKAGMGDWEIEATVDSGARCNGSMKPLGCFDGKLLLNSHWRNAMIRRILFLASNPTDTARLDLEKEAREIEEGLRRQTKGISSSLLRNLRSGSKICAGAYSTILLTSWSSNGGSRTQTVLPSAETADMLFWALLASGQITTRKVDGWQSLADKPSDQVFDLAA